jgi:hypothetical protein
MQIYYILCMIMNYNVDPKRLDDLSRYKSWHN